MMRKDHNDPEGNKSMVWDGLTKKGVVQSKEMPVQAEQEV